ncbi:TetR/AcrR family transcriptional regulator [Phreatobacter stygius]|uniref:TetR/AcrR family transcriptional regulator n=1 Tax=Phreatobacter stygius TaxID=1940610 RepID=A0A4D7B823_9HYPH|nr:TetR/AcrR family transcriptional regulator [Phreatobacter stygius]QCI64107.1 TetR/AcrR family transcriptional regulator [Phreatobacter stygius]
MAERGRPRRFDRVEVLQKAMELFWRRGYDGASVADLTTAMGINSPSLYACFGSKEQLFRDAVALYGETDGKLTACALREGATARQAVDGMLRSNAAAFVRPDHPTGCMVTLAAPTASSQSDAVCQFLMELRRQARAALEERLNRGISDGDLPDGTDTAALTDFYSTVLQGLSIQARDGADPRTMNTIVDCAMAAWHALLPVAPEPPDLHGGQCRHHANVP